MTIGFEGANVTGYLDKNSFSRVMGIKSKLKYSRTWHRVYTTLKKVCSKRNKNGKTWKRKED